MAMMLSKTYDALAAAGAPEDKARDAAEELTGCEARFAGMDRALIEIRGELQLLKWMLAVPIAGVASLVVKTFA
jgi:hypothetical protein